MADYEGRIRLSVQGLPQVEGASKALESAANNADRLSSTSIHLRVSGAEALGKLANQMSAVETRALNLATAVSRIGGDLATVKLNAKIDRRSINNELELVSRQFQRRNWRLNVNDTSVKTARLQVERLSDDLQRLVSKKYTINVDYNYRNPPSGGRAGGRPPTPPSGPQAPGGASPEDIAKRAGEAMAGGLTGRLYSDAVAGARQSAARRGLIERFQQRVQRPQSPGGINQALAQRYIKALGGSTPKGMSPQGMVVEVERLLREVDESVIKNITNRVDELKLAMQMPRNMRPVSRGLPNFNELLDRMAEQTTRPAEAGRMLRMLPSRAITTNLAGLASQQAYRYMGPEMIPQGADELFNEIKRLFGNYFKSLNPTNIWAGPERKAYALQEIMTWQPWMAEPRSQRGQKLLPRAGDTPRAVNVTGFSSMRTSYDEEIAARNISKFAKELFDFRRQIALPPAGANRAITPGALNGQVIPVSVRDITGIMPPSRAGLLPAARGPRLLPSAYEPVSHPYMEPNWNELMDRMAAVTRTPAISSRRLRALPREMVTTDLAGLASDQAAGMFGDFDLLGREIRNLSREAGLAFSPLERISDALRDVGSFASGVIDRVRQSLGRGASSGGGGGAGGGGAGGGGGFTPFGLLPPAGPPFRREQRQPFSASVSDARAMAQVSYEVLSNTSVDERRSGRLAFMVDAYVRSLIDAEQAQRSLNSDIARARQAVQDARVAYIEAGDTQALTRDQVRGARSDITRQRRARFSLAQRRVADQIDELEAGRTPFEIFRNYGQLQGLYGQLPITQRRPALRNLAATRRGAARDVISEVAIGGAFPLLFGQGAATSIGGAVGGAASLFGPGAGFAGGLVGSAIGMQVDTLTKNLGDLASSLKSPTDAIAALETSGFRVSDSLKFQVQQLQSVGRAYDAQTLVLQEVERRLGPGSAQRLNALTTEQRRLEEQSARMAGELQRSLLPAMIGATGFIADLAAGIASIPRPPEWLIRAINLTSPVTAGTQTLFDAASNRGRATAARTPERRAPSPQEALADETARIQSERRLADQVRSTYREAFNLQRQAYDLQYEGARFNKEIADYVWNKEGQIFALRQQASEQQAENLRAATQNRIEQGDLNLRGAFAGAVGFEQQLLNNVREAMRTRKEGEADIEVSRKKLELTMAKLNRDTEDFKRTTAREIEDIERRKLSYVRSVEDYKIRVADYVLERSREAADAMRQAMTLSDQGGAAGGTGGGANASAIANSLINRLNLTPAQAAGVVGNFMRESGVEINPRINEGGAIGAPARRGGYGIAQWTGPRQDALIRFAGSAEKAGELGVQIDFLIRELRTNEGGALRSLRSARTPEEAAKVFERDFERSGIKALGERQRNARQFFNSFTQGAGPGVPVSGGGAPMGAHGLTQAEQATARLTGIADRCAEAVKIFMQSVGVNASVMDMSAKSAEKMGQIMTDWSQLRPGDIVARGAVGDPSHVGVFTGGNNVFHQSRSRGLRAGNFPDLGYFREKGYFIRPSGGPSLQARASMQVSGAPTPQFTPVPIGPTPAAAPINAQRQALEASLGVNAQQAQKILEDQIRLKQQGIELGQIEQILNANQLPQLRQQGEELRRQVEARQQNVNLSDVGASIADLEAERAARLTQIFKDRANSLAKAQANIKGPKDLADAIERINKQSAYALEVAVGEEDQRRKNLDLANQLQATENARTEILQLQQSISAAKVEAASLERRELEVSNVELLKTTTLYQRASAAQQERWKNLTAELQLLNKQNRVTAEIVQLEDRLREIRVESAAIQAGRLRATEVERARTTRGYREGNEAQRAIMEAKAAKIDAQRKQDELGVLRIETRFAGAGLRAGYVGPEARAFEESMKNYGEIDQATKMAEATKAFERQQLVMQNLESNVLSVSDAISGSLTNGLLDIIEGSREIEDVGREMLTNMARSFADSAQQQLSALLQDQVAKLVGAPLAGLLGGSAAAAPTAAGNTAAAASVQTLGTAAMSASGSLMTFGAGLQTLSAQMALFGAMGGGGSLGSALSGIPNFFGASMGMVPDFGTAMGFGGFLANGGTARAGEAYVVGEEEPEFFFPGVTGRVVPRSDMEKAAALRDAGTDVEPIEIRYTVTEQRGERYVTEEQFRKGMAATTKRSQAMTLAGLRNNKEHRDYIAI